MAPLDPLLHVTGLVLAGGRGSRMGGVDKGLQPWHDTTLAERAITRLRPQVATLLVNANRHLDRYAGFGWPVVSDATTDFPGPLAGWLAGLQACTTPWLVTVPCDSPLFPTDLVWRLAAAAAAEDSPLAMAATIEAGQRQAQPVFTLLRRDLATDLAEAMAAGERKIDRWAARHRPVVVVFDDSGAFANVNTLAELQQLQQARHREDTRDA